MDDSTTLAPVSSPTGTVQTTGPADLEPMAGAVEHPLSHGQQALWFLQHAEPANAAYNVARAVRVLGPFDPEAMRRVFQRMVDRHPTLRTTIELRGNRPVQVVHDHLPVSFTVEDAAGWSEEELQERLAAEVRRPFDLARGPLFRVHAFRRSDAETVGLLNLHHTVTDLWSLAILLFEMHALYSEEIGLASAGLRPLRETYTDHVARQRRLLQGDEGQTLAAFWKEALAGAPAVLDLPTDRPRPPMRGFQLRCRSRRLPPALSARLRSLAEERGTDLYRLLFAGYQALLHRYSGQDDFLVGTPHFGRGLRHAGIVGYFVNPLVVRADFAGDPTVAELIERTHHRVGAALEHGAYPFPLLVEQLQPVRDPARAPLFQVMFAWQKTISLHDGRNFTSFILQEDGGYLPVGDVRFESVPVREQVGPFDLVLLMAEAGEELVASLEYSAELFDDASMDRLLGHFETLLEGMVAEPSRRVSELPLLTAAERHRILVEWNDTDAPYPSDRCVHQLFEEQVARAPDRTAVVFGAERLSYRELDERANQLAHYLRSLGVGPESLVGICSERSPDLVVAVLGVLKAGGAYLPLDVRYPRERVIGMLEDAGVEVLLTQAAHCELVPDDVDSVVALDTDWPLIAKQSTRPPTNLAGPDNLAYVIYTSGSTGKPKGVLLHHRGLCNFALANIRAADVGPESRVLQFASFSFDASVAEIFTALLSGASLHLAPRETLLSPPDLVRLVREQGITTVTLPPSMLRLLRPEELPTLRTILSAGESCSGELAARWAEGRRFLNAYGPTETTIGPTWYRAGAEPPDAATVPIGRPIQNMRVYVLDRHRQPVPVGVPGELYIGGVGVARGYLNREELTAEKFVADPFGPDPAARLYRTGDLVRWREDGQLEFLGRLDSQVKLRGFRVELGEIEAALRQHEKIREAAAVVREDLPGQPRLVAYLVPANGAVPAGGELRAFLAERLPDHMLPAVYMPVDALPLSPNGKVDLRALPMPLATRPELDAAYVTPRSDLERRVAAIWQEVLQVERVGVHDNFFELGGHSLLAVQIHGRIQEMLAREFSMVEMFRHPTVATLAEYLERQQQGGDPAAALAEAAQARAERMRGALGRQQRLAAQRRQPPRRSDAG